jgi:hypothetical protein
MNNIEKIKNQENLNGLIGIEAEILNWIVSKVEKSKKEALFIKNIKSINEINLCNPVFLKNEIKM